MSVTAYMHERSAIAYMCESSDTAYTCDLSDFAYLSAWSVVSESGEGLERSDLSAVVGRDFRVGLRVRQRI